MTDEQFNSISDKLDKILEKLQPTPPAYSLKQARMPQEAI